MPQMAPISWLTLFIVFSVTLVLFNAMNYFIFQPNSPKTSEKKNLSITSMNWKW